ELAPRLQRITHGQVFQTHARPVQFAPPPEVHGSSITSSLGDCGPKSPCVCPCEPDERVKAAPWVGVQKHLPKQAISRRRLHDREPGVCIAASHFTVLWSTAGDRDAVGILQYPPTVGQRRERR